MGLLAAFRDRARAAASATSTIPSPVSTSPATACRGRLASGARLDCDVVVNAAGGQGAEIAAMAGLTLPVERRKRTVFAFEPRRPPIGPLPLMIDPTGVWCRPEGARFIAGSPPDPDPEVAHDDFEPRHAEWEALVWPALAARSRAFEALKLTGFWAGHYDMNASTQRPRRPAPRRPEPPLRQRLFRPRPATGARGRPRPGGADRRRVPDPRPRSARPRPPRRRRSLPGVRGDLMPTPCSRRSPPPGPQQRPAASAPGPCAAGQGGAIVSPPPPSTARPATSTRPKPRCAPGTSARSS